MGNIWHNSIGYVYLVNLLIRFGDIFGGYDTLLPRILNASLLGLCAVLVKRIAEQVGLERRKAVIGGLWVILFPMMLYTSGHVFRDTLTLFILLLALTLSTSISTDQRAFFHPKWLVYSAPFIVLIPVMFQLRTLYVLPLAAMLLSAWAFRIIPILKFRGWHSIILVPALISLYFWISNFELIAFGLETIEGYTYALSKGARSAEQGLSLRLFSLPQPLQTFGRLGYAVITPLPVFYDKIELNVLGAGTLVQFFYATYVFLGLKLTYRNARLLPLILGFSIIFFSYAMGTFTFRHITQWFPFAVLIGLIGYSCYERYRLVVFSGAGMLLVLLAFSYILGKTV